MKKNKTSREFYNLFNTAYEFFNDKLFKGSLPPLMLTMQRQNMVMGYYSPGRFARMGSTTKNLVDNQGGDVDEIALNPNMFLPRLGQVEIMQTLVHEMVHHWQQHYGKPGRGGYHNKEFADKMVEIGLYPINIDDKVAIEMAIKAGKKPPRDEPRRTGDKIGDKPVPGGNFEHYFNEFTQKYQIVWVDIQAIMLSEALDKMEERTEEAEILEEAGVRAPAKPQRKKKKPTRPKYTCPGCGCNAWAKPETPLWCGACEERMISELENWED